MLPLPLFGWKIYLHDFKILQILSLLLMVTWFSEKSYELSLTRKESLHPAWLWLSIPSPLYPCSLRWVLDHWGSIVESLKLKSISVEFPKKKKNTWAFVFSFNCTHIFQLAIHTSMEALAKRKRKCKAVLY